MRTRTHLWAGLLSLAVLAAPGAAALADEHGHRDEHERREWREEHERREWREEHERRDFHGRDFHVFTTFEFDLWRGGYWVQDWHAGRFGWWWVADGYWYWYPEPIYPYPTYVPPAPPPAVVIEAPPPPPPPPPAPAVVAAPPPPPPKPAGQPPAAFWYYCEQSQAYYPYVSDCNGPWRQVPATQTAH
jgi:hypothetical protein